MRKAIVHIGPHKTGTTYLQGCFAKRRNELLSRGILAPVEWEHAADNSSHSRLAMALRTEDNFSEMERIVQSAFARANTLLISSEGLSNIGPEGARRLSLLLGGCSVTIIYYVRRWTDILPSGWQELVRQGHGQTFPEFLVNHLRNPEASRTFNFAAQLDGFIDAFGADAVRLVRYSVLCDRG
ncbi:MAG TPA: hypothetical protein VMB71_08880, partial [Acetobacteraceae bacterium]|nr:hypothetical protein [Acetobacteraceae bacterium]